MAKKKEDLKYYESIGRRKSAVARIRMYIPGSKVKGAPKKGKVVINDMSADDYFPTDVMRKLYRVPLELTDSENRFGISILTRGGGKHAQMEAIQLGLARALEKADPSFRPTLKAEGLLTRDARVRERRKPGTGGKARRQKQSPKR